MRIYVGTLLLSNHFSYFLEHRLIALHLWYKLSTKFLLIDLKSFWVTMIEASKWCKSNIFFQLSKRVILSFFSVDYKKDFRIVEWISGPWDCKEKRIGTNFIRTGKQIWFIWATQQFSRRTLKKAYRRSVTDVHLSSVSRWCFANRMRY